MSEGFACAGVGTHRYFVFPTFSLSPKYKDLGWDMDVLSREFHLGASIYRQVFQRLFHFTNVTCGRQDGRRILPINGRTDATDSNYTAFDARLFLEAGSNSP